MKGLENINISKLFPVEKNIIKKHKEIVKVIKNGNGNHKENELIPTWLLLTYYAKKEMSEVVYNSMIEKTKKHWENTL